MDEQFWDRLERDGLLTHSEIAQVRARHAAAGGAPDTAINEIHPLSSDERARLRRLLARAVDQPQAPPAFLDAPEAEALALVPRELADRYSVLAARLTPQLLTIVVPALSSQVLAELSFVVGRKVQPYVGLESDIRYALSRHMGLPLPPRFQAMGAPPPTPAPRGTGETADPPSVPGGSVAGDPPSGAGQLKSVNRGWGAGGGLTALRSLRTEPPEALDSQPPAALTPIIVSAGSRDWVASALETLRLQSTPAQTAHALGQIGAPGMVDLIFLLRTETGLAGYVASHGGVALDRIAEVKLAADPDTVIGRALLKRATRCGPFRDDAAFGPLYQTLGLPPPCDVLVAPIKRGDTIVGVFVGDHGPVAISPVTASAVRRLLTGLVDLWPATPDVEPRPTAETLLGIPSPAHSTSLAPPAAAPEPMRAPRSSSHAPTEELVALTSTPPLPAEVGAAIDAVSSAVDDPMAESESSPAEPEWELPMRPPSRTDGKAETRLGMPAFGSAMVAGEADIELFDSADVAEITAASRDPRPETPAGPDVGDTVLDQRPMGLAEFAEALALEAGRRPLETQSAVMAMAEPSARGPTPRLLDLDNMVTVPALARVRPAGPLPEVQTIPTELTPPPTRMDVDPGGLPAGTAAAISSTEPEPPAPPAPASPSIDLDEPRPLPFPSPGWTDELPIPAVTAVRAIRIDNASTDFDLAAMRFAAQSHPPRDVPPDLPVAPPPTPASARLSFSPTPFDPPSGPMPRVTVIVTPNRVGNAIEGRDLSSDPPSVVPRGPTQAEPEPTPFRFEPEPTLELAHEPAPAPTPAPPPARKLYTDADIKLAIEGLSAADLRVRQQSEDLLLAVGEPALDPIFEGFPGQILVDRFAHPVGSPGIETHSALLRVVVRLGPLATGRLEQLCGHLSPEIRYYAVFCFSALRSARSLPIVAERLTDSDNSVREISIWVLEQYRGQAAFKAVVDTLRAGLKEGSARRRRPLVDSVGRLHLADAIPELLLLLGDLSLGLQEAAHKALQEIARADLGLDAWKWQKWYERNGNRPRVEWLLEGLLSDHRTIRAGALQELRRLTHQNYGYMVDAPPAERRSAHERWMRWWRDAGMVRFAGYR